MKHYNISSKEEISIFTKNFIVEGEKVPKILYEFYVSGNNKLDSSRICKGIFKDIPENCSEYTKESLIKNYCTECDEEYNYYPVYVSDNNNSKFKKCYNDKEGYYYDNISKLYKPCYETCRTCEKNGSSSVNNCLKCKKKNPFKYKSNCYEYCHNNTYNESTNEYICLEEPKCLEKEKKLFMNNKSCIDDCSKDNIYNHEFNKICYDACPENSSPSEKNQFLCEVKCPPDKPYENLINHQCLHNMILLHMVCILVFHHDSSDDHQ